MSEKAHLKETDRYFDAKYEQMAYYLDKKVRLRDACALRGTWGGLMRESTGAPRHQTHSIGAMRVASWPSAAQQLTSATLPLLTARASFRGGR